MSDYTLDQFLEQCKPLAEGCADQSECVGVLANAMRRLLLGKREFLKPEHFRADPNHYARNAIYIAPDDSYSLFSMVWSPGQWTPIHDHGTWGVVGVVEGVLEERAFIRVDDQSDPYDNVELVRGGLSLLGENSVTTFVPNPDHIHRTGVPADRPRAVSLHLYGRNMDNYYVYSLGERTRRLVGLACNEAQ